MGVHHVALICADLGRSLAFYRGLLGLPLNPDRPDDKLPYPGAWLWIGARAPRGALAHSRNPHFCCRARVRLFRPSLLTSPPPFKP